MDEFSPNSLPSKTTDIDESNKEDDNRNASDHSGEQGKEHALPSKKQEGGDAEEDNRNALDHSAKQGKEQALLSKKQDGGDAEEYALKFLLRLLFSFGSYLSFFC